MARRHHTAVLLEQSTLREDSILPTLLADPSDLVDLMDRTSRQGITCGCDCPFAGACDPGDCRVFRGTES